MKIRNLLLKPFYKLMSIPYNLNLKKGVTKKDFTIISNDCCGGVIYHRIGKKFSSPFINLYIEHDDYIKLLKNLDYYLSSELVEIHSEEKYPIGILGSLEPIKLHFYHYNSFFEAKNSWDKRKQRIIKDKLFILFNLTNEFDEEYVRKYIQLMEKLNYKNWMILSRFASTNPNVKTIDFSGLENPNLKVLASEKIPYKMPIDQINYKDTFKIYK